MLDHYIQKNIVYRLAFANKLKFSELKPDELDNKLFTYHLKKVVAAGLVRKTEDNLYELTPEGRRVGIRVFEKQLALANRPESVLFLVIRRKRDGAWLLYRRSVHPLKDRVGFMHADPSFEIDCIQSAREVCLEKTGISCEFVVQGGGYFRVFNSDELESFTHFNLLVCEDAEGELSQADEFAEYYWEPEPDFASADMLPDMPLLSSLYLSGDPFFIEETFNI